MRGEALVFEPDGGSDSDVAGFREEVADGRGTRRLHLLHPKLMLMVLGAVATCLAALALLDPSASAMRAGGRPRRRSGPSRALEEERGRVSCAHPVPAAVRDAATAPYVNRSVEVCGFEGVGELGPGGGFSPSEAGTRWQAYAELHKKIRSRLARGESGQRILVWHCLSDESCGGTGDQARGLATALFAAMESNRALFIRWRRDDLDVTGLLGRRGIDWRLPIAFPEDSCRNKEYWYISFKHSLGKEFQDFSDFVHSDDDCLAVKTNLVPGEAISEATLGSYVNDSDNNIVGCAMRFLFSFDSAYRELGRAVRLCRRDGAAAAAAGGGLVAAGDPGAEAPWAERYVAVHLRFGDRVFRQEDDHGHGDRPEQSMVRDALACAAALGRELFGGDRGWGIFLASDSAEARKLALVQDVGAPVFISSHAPTHSNGRNERWRKARSKAAEEPTLWSSWGDQLLLSRAEALVQCFDLGRQCWVSGFSQLAANVGFIPLANMRIRKQDGCVAEASKRMNGRYHGCRNSLKQKKGHCEEASKVQ